MLVEHSRGLGFDGDAPFFLYLLIPDTNVAIKGSKYKTTQQGFIHLWNRRNYRKMGIFKKQGKSTVKVCHSC